MTFPSLHIIDANGSQLKLTDYRAVSFNDSLDLFLTRSDRYACQDAGCGCDHGDFVDFYLTLDDAVAMRDALTKMIDTKKATP